MEERRMFERFSVQIPVKFLNLSTKKQGSGKVINISAGGGGMILTKEHLPSSSHLEMQFFITDNKDVFRVKGRVVWSKMVESDTYMAGIKFDEIDFMGIARALRFTSTSKLP